MNIIHKLTNRIHKILFSKTLSKFRLSNKLENLLCRLHENGEWIAIRTDFDSRANFLEQYPESCFITPHYENYPYICLQVNSYNSDLAKAILESGFRAITAKKIK